MKPEELKVLKFVQKRLGESNLGQMNLTGDEMIDFMWFRQWLNKQIQGVENPGSLLPKKDDKPTMGTKGDKAPSVPKKKKVEKKDG